MHLGRLAHARDMAVGRVHFEEVPWNSDQPRDWRIWPTIYRTRQTLHGRGETYTNEERDRLIAALTQGHGTD